MKTDLGKIIFDFKSPQDLGQAFPDATKHEIALLRHSLRYDRRLSAIELLQLPYFAEYPPKLARLIPEDKRVRVAPKKYEEIFNIQNQH